MHERIWCSSEKFTLVVWMQDGRVMQFCISIPVYDQKCCVHSYRPFGIQYIIVHTPSYTHIILYRVPTNERNGFNLRKKLTEELGLGVILKGYITYMAVYKFGLLGPSSYGVDTHS